MPPGPIAAGRARAIRALLALIAVSACLGAVAYAATRPEHPVRGLAESKPLGVAPQHGGGPSQRNGEEPLLRPRFIEYPASDSTEAKAQFRFHVPPRSQPPSPVLPGPPGGPRAPTRRFKCSLDEGEWRACSSPYRLTGLVLGTHIFEVRALNRAGRPGPAISHSWRKVPPSPAQPRMDPKPFSMDLRGELEDLHPGFPPQQVPILVTNPNPVPIEITDLTVAIAGDPPSCSAESFAVTPSSASPTAPLVVPAGASVDLPTATTSAPTIGMLNLPVNQDACQGTDIPLVFNGEAHG